MPFVHPPARDFSRVDRRIQVVLGAAAAVAAISLSPGSAQAYVVTVGGVQYDVTTFTGTYSDNIGKFRTPANGGVMPWWGVESTANAFAAAVGSLAGEPNNLSGNTFGPIFAVRFEGSSPGNVFGRYYGYNGSNAINDYYRAASEPRVWAQVSPVSTPAPGPLPALGAAAAYGFSRQLRKRIQGRFPAGSALPLA